MRHMDWREFMYLPITHDTLPTTTNSAHESVEELLALRIPCWLVKMGPHGFIPFIQENKDIYHVLYKSQRKASHRSVLTFDQLALQ